MIRRLFIPVVFVCLTLSDRTSTASAQCQPLIVTDAIIATGWAPKAFIFGEERKAVKSRHILDRPNRPLHFYGNTVRFIHYRHVAQQSPICAQMPTLDGHVTTEEALVSEDIPEPPDPVAPAQ